MIRLLHFADLHLGVENYGRTDPDTGLSTRLMDFLAAFDAVIDHALGGEIDLVLFAGDAFKNRDPSPTHLREFARRIRRLAEAQIPTVLLVGNHDLPNALQRAHAIEIFQTLETPYITVAGRAAVHKIETRKGPVQVAALPWVTRSHLLAREESAGLTNDQLNEMLEQGMATIIGHLASRLDPALPAVLLAHGTAQGASYGAERNVMLGQDVLLDRAALADPRFDYVALGHIHKHQVVSGEPPVLYSGSIERIDFGEANEAKGFVVAEIGDGPARWQFFETPTRPFKALTINVRDSADPMADIQRQLERVTLDEAVVKLIIQATPENEGYIDIRAVRRLLQPAAYIAAIVRDVERPQRLRLGSAQEIASSTPRQLLERYLISQETEPAQRERLLAAADGLLAEIMKEEA